MKERWKERERLVDRKREGGVEENKEKNLDYYKKKNYSYVVHMVKQTKFLLKLSFQSNISIKHFFSHSLRPFNKVER